MRRLNMMRLGMTRLMPLVLLAGCAALRPALAPLPNPGGQGAAAAPLVDGEVGSPRAAPPVQQSRGQVVPTEVPAAPASQVGGNITLDFADTDIREVAAQILGAMLHLNYTIDPAVHGTATLHTSVPLTRAELLPTLSVLLNQAGASLVQTANLYRVLPSAMAASAPGIAGGPPGLGSTIVPLRYASADALAKVLQPFATNGARIAADPAHNAVVVSGEPAARETLAGLVRAFDVDALAGNSLLLLPAEDGNAKAFAQSLQQAVGAEPGGPRAGVVRIVPMERVNAVLVAAPDARTIADVRRLYELVARQRDATRRSWHVYYLQNGRSNDVAYVLQQAFTPNHVTAQPTPAGPPRNMLAGGAASGAGGGGANGLASGVQQSGLAGGQSGGLGQTAGGGGLGTQSAPPLLATTTTTPGADANPLLGGLDQPTGNTGEADADTMRIIPNDQNNALLIYATRNEFDTVEAMLHKIDILPLQVRIDATIAEVTLNDQLQFGTQYFFRQGGLNGMLTAAFTAGFPGFLLTGNDSTQVALDLLQSVTKVQVLSSPELLVLDNQPARLQVGNLVPYLTSQSQSTLVANSAIVNSVQYQQTGVILQVTPRVNNSGLVTLDISQEVSDVATGTTTAGLNSPTFLERNVQSRVVVQDGQTIGLAGLIRDSSTRGNQGVPYLKDVPLLGLLFGQQSNSRARTELLVLVTPHVIHDQRDALALTEDLRDQLVNAALVPQELQASGPTGSADPSRRGRRALGLER